MSIQVENEARRALKPLGGPAYGSIGHLPGSRLGPADRHVPSGQDAICTIKTRDKHDIIVVQEKLDGACCAVAKINGEIVPIGRKGYPVLTAPQNQIRLFHSWVMEREQRFRAMLAEGERAVGEWMVMVAGIPYNIDSEDGLFVIFDLMMGNHRALSQQVYDACDSHNLAHVCDLHRGGAIHPEELIEQFPDKWNHGPAKCAEPEGLVYRVERNGEVDYLAKWVRPTHVPGQFFSDHIEVWNHVGRTPHVNNGASQ